jgi:hypothetical protein
VQWSVTDTKSILELEVADSENLVALVKPMASSKMTAC